MRARDLTFSLVLIKLTIMITRSWFNGESLLEEFSLKKCQTLGATLYYKFSSLYCSNVFYTYRSSLD